jgi:hypothetical protein
VAAARDRDVSGPLPSYLTDPAKARWRAAQKIATRPGPTWVRIGTLPEGEELWRERSATATRP